MLTFIILTGIPSLLKETNSGLIPISILEKFDVGKLIAIDRDPISRVFADELYKKLVFYMSNSVEDNIEFGRKFVNTVKNKYDISIEKEKIEAYYRKLLD